MSLTVSRRGLFRGLIAGRPVSDEAAQDERFVARIGSACVEPKGVSCRRCGEACDADAIRFRPIGGGIAAPTLSADACTGCGDCLSVCPTSAISLLSADRVALIQGLAAAGENA